MLPGLGLIAAGLALFAMAPAAGGGYLSHIFPVALLAGAGAGLCFPALMTLAMSSATPQDAGLASGLVNTTAQIGGAPGVAVLATRSPSTTPPPHSPRPPPPPAPQPVRELLPAGQAS